jgi:RNA polymerase sigma-70 factor (ECF subfamily)
MAVESVSAKEYTGAQYLPKHQTEGHYFMSDDVKLMLRLKDGDESAFETLVERHRTRVINTAYRFTGQRDVAEDLAQDVFISLYRAAPRYEPRAKFTTYLYRIVANRCFNHNRRRKLARFFSLDSNPYGEEGAPSAFQPVDQRATPEQESAHSELTEQIDAALAKLPERQRLAVVLRHYKGLSYAEIGESLSQPISAVKSLLHRGMMGLRVSLKKKLHQ